MHTFLNWEYIMPYISITECSATISQITEIAQSLTQSCTLHFDFKNPSVEQILAVAYALPRGAVFVLHPDTELDIFILTAQNLKNGHFFKMHPKTPDSVVSETLNNARCGVVIMFNNKHHRLFDQKPRTKLESREEFQAKLDFLTSRLGRFNA